MSKIEEDPRGHGGAGAGVGIGIGASTPEHKETVRAACLRSLLRLWLPGCVCCLVRAQSQCVCWVVPGYLAVESCRCWYASLVVDCARSWS